MRIIFGINDLLSVGGSLLDAWTRIERPGTAAYDTGRTCFQQLQGLAAQQIAIKQLAETKILCEKIHDVSLTLPFCSDRLTPLTLNPSPEVRRFVTVVASAKPPPSRWLRQLAAYSSFDLDDEGLLLLVVGGSAVNNRPPKPPPIAEAIHWVSRITSVGLMMVLPILGGRWLDERWNTGYWAPLGLVLGLVLGFYQLLQIATASKRRNKNRSDEPPNRDSDRPSLK